MLVMLRRCRIVSLLQWSLLFWFSTQLQCCSGNVIVEGSNGETDMMLALRYISATERMFSASPLIRESKSKLDSLEYEVWKKNAIRAQVMIENLKKELHVASESNLFSLYLNINNDLFSIKAPNEVKDLSSSLPEDNREISQLSEEEITKVIRARNTIFEAIDSAELAAWHNVHSYEAVQEARKKLQYAIEEANYAAAKTAEAVTLIAAAKAINRRSQHHLLKGTSFSENLKASSTTENMNKEIEEWWSSVDGIDKWLVEELFSNQDDHLHSLNGEDDKDKKDKHWFVDIGANDGVSRSQTYALESRFHWKGVCIEANDVSFKALKYARPQCSNVHACVSDKDGELESFAVDHSILIDHSTGELYSGMYSGILDTNKNRDGVWNSDLAPKQMCETRTLQQILINTNAPTFVDFLSIDCEGCEFNVLSSFPFDRYKFGVIIFEHNGDISKRLQIRSVLELNGYVGFEFKYPDDTYLLSHKLWPEHGYEKAKKLTSVLTPYTSLLLRNQLLSNHFLSIGERKILPPHVKYACPLEISEVFLGGGSGSCPIPSCHNGYQPPFIDSQSILKSDTGGGDSINRPLPRTVYTKMCPFEECVGNKATTKQVTREVLSASVESLEDGMKRYGATQSVVDMIIDYINANTEDFLSSVLSSPMYNRHADYIMKSNQGRRSNLNLKSEVPSKTSTLGAYYVRTSISMSPNPMAKVQPQSSSNSPKPLKDNIESSKDSLGLGEYKDSNQSKTKKEEDRQFVLQQLLKNEYVSVDFKTNFETKHIFVNETIHRDSIGKLCAYIGDIDGKGCDHISNVMLKQAIPLLAHGMMQTTLGQYTAKIQNDASSNIHVHDDLDFNSRHVSFQLYSDSCVMAKGREENMAIWETMLHPDQSCVSLGWFLTFILNDDNHISGQPMLRPQMEAMDRNALSETSQILLRRAAAMMLE